MLVFSTHAFTEGDGTSNFPPVPRQLLNSRLHGRRRSKQRAAFCITTSQLTPSRKATATALFLIMTIFFSTHAFTEGDNTVFSIVGKHYLLNSRLHGRRLQIQIIFAAKHFLFLLILSKFLILAFLFHLASLRFSLHPVIFRCESPCIFLFIYLSHSKHVHSVIIFNLLHYISPLIFYQLKICFNLISLLFKINLLKFFVIFYWHRKMPVIKFIKF